MSVVTDPRRRREAVIEAFERAWHSGPRPVIDDYLPTDRAERRALLPELVHADLEFRLKAGDVADAAGYLARYPTLAADRAFVLNLQAADRTLRERFSVPAALTPPLIAGYEILEELGRGGMGVVYKARQLRPNRLVALKMILAGVHASVSELARFRREAEAVARLGHPNFVQIHEVGERDGLPYLALEYVAGGSLADRLRGQPQAAALAAELVEVLARAMDVAHARGIVHRDLKPANVLLAQEEAPASTVVGQRFPPVKIADFGLALELDGTSGRTQSGAILGTPSYMAPEQAAGARSVIGAAVDVYALGAILYELLTGRPPFRAQTPFDTIAQVLHDEPVAPSRLSGRIPRDLETICLTCLRKQPAKRYDSALALAADLRAFIEGRAIRARPYGPIERVSKWVRRRPTFAALFTTVVAVAFVGFTAVTWQWRRAEFALGTVAEKAAAETRARTEADLAKRDALAQAETARQALAAAEHARRRTESALGEARTSAYLSRVGQAEREWLAGDPRRAETLLAGCPEDLRCWEWTYLHRLCQGSRLTLRGHGRRVSGVSFIPDGSTLASASEDGTVRLWDAHTGTETACLSGHPRGVAAVAFSPDGTLLASGGAEGEVRLWNSDGTSATVFRGHVGRVRAVAFGATSWLLASGGDDGAVRVWNRARASCVATLLGHTAAVTAIAITPDGQRLVSGGEDRTVRVWDLTAAKELRSLTGHSEPVRALAVSGDGRLLASAGDERRVLIHELANGQEVAALTGHVTAVLGVSFGPVGQSRQQLASAAVDGTVAVWDVGSGRQAFALPGQNTSCAGVAFSPDGQALATAGGDGAVRVWDTTRGGESLSLFGHGHEVSCVAVSRDGRRFATGSRDKTVLVWDYADSTSRGTRIERRASLRGHEGWVTAVVLLGDGATVASASVDGSIRLWDVNRGEEVHRLLGHEGAVLGLAANKEGTMLASAGRGGVLLWDVASGTSRPALPHSQEATAVAVSPSGELAVAGTGGGLVRVWDVKQGTLLRTLSGHAAAVTSVLFDASARRIVSAGTDQTIRLWDVGTGLELRVFHGHGGPITGLALTPDRHRLASVAADHALKLWDVDSGQEALTLRSASAALSVAFTPDGRHLLVGGSDTVITVRE